MARIKKGISGKRKILLFVEGKTEKLYFEFLRQKLRLPNVNITPVILDNSGQNWIEKAKLMVKNDNKYRSDENTDVYVIFDKDEFTVNELQKMVKVAKEANFNIGFSNIMFEVWLLAHFEKITGSLLSKQVLLAKISKHLNRKYIKANSDQLEIMVDAYKEAMENASSITEINYHEQCTNIGCIICGMRGN